MAKVNTYTVTYTNEGKGETIEAEVEILMEDGDDVDEELGKANERIAKNIVDIKEVVNFR